MRHAALTEPCWSGAAVGPWKVRWFWKLAIAAGAGLWSAILVFTGVIGIADVLGVAALGALNTAAGVAVHQAALWSVRAIRRDRPARVSSLQPCAMKASRRHHARQDLPPFASLACGKVSDVRQGL